MPPKTLQPRHIIDIDRSVAVDVGGDGLVFGQLRKLRQSPLQLGDVGNRDLTVHVDVLDHVKQLVTVLRTLLGDIIEIGRVERHSDIRVLTRRAENNAVGS